VKGGVEHPEISEVKQGKLEGGQHYTHGKRGKELKYQYKPT